MSLIDDMIRKVIKIAGVELRERKYINFVSGVSGTDDPNTNSTDLVVTGDRASVVIDDLEIDWSLASVFTQTLAAGGNTFTFANASDGQVIVVVLTGYVSTVTWPTVQWASGIPPTQTSSGTDVYTFVKAGSTVFGSAVQDMS